MAKAHGARLILLNYGATHMDDVADVIIHDDVAEVLPRLAAPWTAPRLADALAVLMAATTAPLAPLMAALDAPDAEQAGVSPAA